MNEAFAAQYQAVEKELGLDREKVNVNGGAIALGHPLGATGTPLVITLLYELRRRKKKYGLATACIGEDRGLPWWWRAFTSSFHHGELSGSWTMISILKKLWPPTKNGKLSVLWALVFGFVLQLALPAVLIALGSKGAALLAIYPGLLPIIWATRGWFAGISPQGYVVMYIINTLVYGALLLIGFRLCGWLRRQYE